MARCNLNFSLKHGGDFLEGLQQVPDHPERQKHIFEASAMPVFNFSASMKDRQYLPVFTNTRCHPGQGHCHLLCGEWLCWAPSIRWNLPWPGCAIHQEGVNGVCSHLSPDPRPRSCQEGAPRSFLSKEQGLPLLRALLHLLQIFLNSLSFVLSHSGAFQGFPEKPSSITILWEWKAALHLSLISHKCYSPMSASPSPLCLFPVTPWPWQP